MKSCQLCAFPPVNVKVCLFKMKTKLDPQFIKIRKECVSVCVLRDVNFKRTSVIKRFFVETMLSMEENSSRLELNDLLWPFIHSTIAT